MNKLTRPSEKNIHEGLLLLRIGIGFMFIMHGAPKISGGPETWEKIGQAMGFLGINFGYSFWGFMAAFAETFGGLFLAAGLLFYPACLLLFVTMLVAAMKHLMEGDGFAAASHAIESAILFLSLVFTGPGKYSLDKRVFHK